MDIGNVCVVGGSGFVGSHIVHLLSAQGTQVLVPTRNRERAKRLILLPTVDAVQADVHDLETLKRLFRGKDAVISLVGILHETRRGDFRATHTDLPRKIVEAAKAVGVRRLVHMSALHASPSGPSEYLRTKGEAEKVVKESGLDWTIFRPSVIFGREDSFLNLFAEITRLLPVLFLAKPDAKFQPVYVEDVAQAFVRSLGDADTFGQSYDLCGPNVYTLREIVQFVGGTTGHQPTIIGLGDGLSYLQARMMELLPMKLMTRDNLDSMKIDSVCGCDFPAVFGIRPATMEAVVPFYLVDATPRGRYYGFRYRAGR
jgi:uncharacterized protein YbjT (DUF2867 family)